MNLLPAEKARKKHNGSTCLRSLLNRCHLRSSSTRCSPTRAKMFSRFWSLESRNSREMLIAKVKLSYPERRWIWKIVLLLSIVMSRLCFTKASYLSCFASRALKSGIVFLIHEQSRMFLNLDIYLEYFVKLSRIVFLRMLLSATAFLIWSFIALDVGAFLVCSNSRMKLLIPDCDWLIVGMCLFRSHERTESGFSQTLTYLDFTSLKKMTGLDFYFFWKKWKPVKVSLNPKLISR